MKRVARVNIMANDSGNGPQWLTFPIDQIAAQCEAAFVAPMRAEGRLVTILVGVGAAQLRTGDPFRLRELLDDLLTHPDPAQDRSGLSFSGRPGQPLIIDATGVAAPSARAIELAAALRGTLVAHGRGWRLTLPFESAEAEEVLPPLAAASGEDQIFRELRLLIADDSRTNLMVIHDMLSDTGAEITTAADGQQVLDLWREAPFDMLLLDIAMPFVDGLTALRMIRSEEEQRQIPHIPAIAVTANAMAHQVDQYILGGFDMHIAKPFRRRELIDAISALMPLE